MTAKKTREEILENVAKKAGDYEVEWFSCAQGTLLALQEQFNLKSEEALKAATAMPGIALRGDTCGAVVGAIMALGLAFGRKEPEDSDSLVRTMGAAKKFCRRFEAEFGGCNCRDVQHKVFGRSYNFSDPADQAAFRDAGGSETCRIPSSKAARIAGELILDLQGE